MEEELPNLALRVPENCIGMVLGEINSRRGLILDMKNNSGIVAVKAKLPMEEIQNYKEWFAEFTNGKGEFVAL